MAGDRTDPAMDRATLELRAALSQIAECDARDASWTDGVLASAEVAVEIATLDIPEIAQTLSLLRQLATSDDSEIPDRARGIAWYYIGKLSLAQSDGSPADHQATAEAYQRALRFFPREANSELWARMHAGIGIAYCEKLRAISGGSFDSWRSLLVAARVEFEAALGVLTLEAFPDDHREITQLLRWSVESLNRLKKRPGWPAA